MLELALESALVLVAWELAELVESVESALALVQDPEVESHMAAIRPCGYSRTHSSSLCCNRSPTCLRTSREALQGIAPFPRTRGACSTNYSGHPHTMAKDGCRVETQRSSRIGLLAPVVASALPVASALAVVVPALAAPVSEAPVSVAPALVEPALVALELGQA